MAITGSSDAQQASSYIEMANNDIQTAVDLFFQYSSAAPTAASGNAAAGTSIPMAEDQVRAPDRTRSEQLIGGFGNQPPSYAGLMDPRMGIDNNGPYRGMPTFAEHEIGTLEAISGSIRDVANAAANEDDEVQDVTPPINGSRSTTLSNMFAPPHHLIHSAGGFQGARNVAKDSRRWLLVNLQRDQDFACHALNRDVWRDELVENLVREGFIFWQSEDTADDGRTYATRYNVNAFPHIAIIDPRTARLIYRNEGWTQENPMTAERFAEIAADFCSRHSFDHAPIAPRVAGKKSSTANATAAVDRNDGGIASANVGRPAREMTEEEQLQAAIRASMNASMENNDNDDNDIDDDSAEYIMGADGDSSMELDNVEDTTNAAVTEEEKEPSFQDVIIAMEVGDEPADKSKAARIMIRMPDGKRLVRKFNLNDTVKIIYAFVAQSNDDTKGGKEFELKAGFPPKNLLSSVDESIASAGLAGENISVRWKEN